MAAAGGTGAGGLPPSEGDKFEPKHFHFKQKPAKPSHITEKDKPGDVHHESTAIRSALESTQPLSPTSQTSQITSPSSTREAEQKEVTRTASRSLFPEKGTQPSIKSTSRRISIAASSSIGFQGLTSPPPQHPKHLQHHVVPLPSSTMSPMSPSSKAPVPGTPTGSRTATPTTPSDKDKPPILERIATALHLQSPRSSSGSKSRPPETPQIKERPGTHESSAHEQQRPGTPSRSSPSLLTRAVTYIGEKLHHDSRTATPVKSPQKAKSPQKTHIETETKEEASDPVNAKKNKVVELVHTMLVQQENTITAPLKALFDILKGHKITQDDLDYIPQATGDIKIEGEGIHTTYLIETSFIDTCLKNKFLTNVLQSIATYVDSGSIGSLVDPHHYHVDFLVDLKNLQKLQHKKDDVDFLVDLKNLQGVTKEQQKKEMERMREKYIDDPDTCINIPNPAQFKIDFDQNKDDVDVLMQLFNQAGKEVKSLLTVNMNNLVIAKGLYPFVKGIADQSHK